MNLEALESILQIKFKNKDLLLQAITHKSITGNSKDLSENSYERLEFLGDSILSYIVGEYFYSAFPNASEGELTKYRSRVVRGTTLEFVSEKIGLGPYVLVADHLREDPHFTIPLDDVYESIIGAIYLENGLNIAKDFIYRTLLKEPQIFLYDKDPKTRLQEIIQKQYHTNAISYEVIKESGPDNQKQFYVVLKINDKVFSYGSGSSKKKAEKMAAEIALKGMKNGEK